VVTGFVTDGAVTRQPVLGDTFVTLAEVLREHGYATFGISTNGHLSVGTGFGQGFDRLEEIWWKDAAQVGEKVAEVREDFAEADRAFLWVHYFDPHSKYEAREPWHSAFGGGPSDYDRLGGGDHTALKRLVLEGADPASLRDPLLALYDSEVAHVDAAVREVYATLDLGPDALWVVTSDHGEGFYEHGRVAHGQTLYQEEVWVPLLVRPPGGQDPLRIDVPVSNMDVYPTILDYIGLASPPGLAGQSLRPLASGTSEKSRPVYLELARSGPPSEAVRTGKWKLYKTSSRPRLQFFDLEEDPGEQKNLARHRREQTELLSTLLERWNTRWPAFEPQRTVADLRPEDVEALRRLGYLGAPNTSEP
jgi:arylsulfatase A-like enzyme